jgi:hypothetical protein
VSFPLDSVCSCFLLYDGLCRESEADEPDLQSTTSFSESRAMTPLAGELNPRDSPSFYRSIESNGSQEVRIEVMDESSIKERLSE